MEQVSLSPQNLNRRIFIKDIGWITLGLFAGLTMGGCEGCREQIANRPLRRRIRAGSPEVDAVMEVYKDAVQKMKQLSTNNAADPRGWAAQAAIHGVNPGGFNLCQHGTDHFFSWHRAYLVWFERICQQLTGDKSFGLPYWNWNQDPDIPAPFLQAGSILNSPRNLNSMAGDASVSNSTLNLIFSDHNFYTFSQQLEGTPHNTVHTHIGNNFGSGGSATDPLFWVHHCMVDYCWAKWNLEMDNDNTNDGGWIGTGWNHFVDASGNITNTTAGATTLMPLLSYRYESSPIGSNGALRDWTKAEFQKLETRVRKGAPIRFDIRERAMIAETATLSLAQPFVVRTKPDVSQYTKIFGNDKSKETLFASIQYASLPVTSDFFVRVFINLPGATVTTPVGDPHFAGSFAFFGTDPANGGHGTAHHVHAPRFLVNITPTVETLLRSGELKEDSEISISLVAVPVADQFRDPGASLQLTKLELIVTPVIIPSQGKE